MSPQDPAQGLLKPDLMNHIGQVVESKGLVSTFQEGYELLVQAIIRPPRSSYDESMLGPRRFMFAGRVHHRQDLDVPSNRPDRCILKCSHFKPEPKEGERPLRRPCVIFLHGNAASRLEGLCIIKTVLAASADLFLFDFGGSGMSEGDYVSLGHWEKEDLAAVVERLRADNVSSIGLWGRSMGAVTALLYAVRDASIAGIVVDSPFTDLRTLAGELCEKETYGAVPTWLADAALSVIRVSIQQRLGFDLDELRPIEKASSTNIPAIFGAALEDDFIYPHHARMIQEEYCGQSRLINFEGDHNSDRPQEFLDDVRKFFMRTLHSSYSSQMSDIWKLDNEKPDPVRLEAQRALKERELRTAESQKRHKELLMQSPFGIGESSGPMTGSIPIPEPPAPEQSQASKRGIAGAGHERPSRDRPRYAPGDSRTESPQRQAARPPPGGGGRESFAAHQIAAPSLDKSDIKQQLLALGFAPSQVEAAMLRSSTLEGCVEWILASL